MESKELIDNALTIAEKLEKTFNKRILCLSIVDWLFGILALVLTSLTVTVLWAGAMGYTAIRIFGRVVQLARLAKVEEALRIVNVVAISWFVRKYQKYLKNKGEKKMQTEKITNSRIVSIIGIVLGVVFASLTYFVPDLVIGDDAMINYLIATGVEAVSIIISLVTKGTRELTDEEKTALQEKMKKASEKGAELKKAKIEKLEAKLAEAKKDENTPTEVQ